MIPGIIVLRDADGRKLLEVSAWHLLAIMRFHGQIGPHVPHLPHRHELTLLIDGQEVELPPKYDDE